MFTVLKATYLRMLSSHSHRYFHISCIFSACLSLRRSDEADYDSYDKSIHDTRGRARVDLRSNDYSDVFTLWLCTASANELRLKTGIKKKSSVVSTSAFLCVYGGSAKVFRFQCYSLIIDRQLSK